MIRIKRIYDPHESGDGRRVLVDRLWPRGVAKETAQIDEWLKEIAPSNELRQRFHHDKDKWEEFQQMYFKELDQHPDLVEQLIRKSRAGDITLLYAAKDEIQNNAIALKNYLENKLR